MNLQTTSAAALLGAVLLGSIPAQAADPVIAAAGDIACDPTNDPNWAGGFGTPTACRMRATSDLILGGGFDAVLLLGDNQYYDGTLEKYYKSFHPTWGRLGKLLRPAPGNHEYASPGAVGYFSYFGVTAAPQGRSYYSYDLGTWHIVALDSNCGAVGGCGPGSPQATWLAQDLAAHPRACTLAYWHHPRFSSGLHGDDPTYDTFWRILHQAGADVVLVGHDHNYERFAPQNPAGQADPERGITQFVVGTGGINLRPFETIRNHSVARNAQAFGVLSMALRPGGWDWDFLPIPGNSYTDRGSAVCHTPPDATVLFLHGGRFRVEVAWKDFDGNTGPGHAAPPAGDDSALFWFFGPANWELLVKVLDGCAVNGRYWVFSAATTNVDYVLTVTDTLTGQAARYENPAGRTAPALTDTAAFDCP